MAGGITQGLLENAGAKAATVSDRSTGAGEKLVRSRNLEELLVETNLLLRKILMVLKIKYAVDDSDIDDEVQPELEGDE